MTANPGMTSESILIDCIQAHALTDEIEWHDGDLDSFMTLIDKISVRFNRIVEYVSSQFGESAEQARNTAAEMIRSEETARSLLALHFA